MALYMALKVNNEQIGYLYARRLAPGQHANLIGPDEICQYEWEVGLNGKIISNIDDTPLNHRFGAGAWTLVAEVIDAAGYGAGMI